MSSTPPFIHLRVRSAYSLLEGAIRIDQLAELCRERQMPAVALTDTNNLFGALEFSEKLSKAGVQPIVGCSLAVAHDERPLGETRREPVGTIALLAQDEAGYKNLLKLSSKAFLEVQSDEQAHVAFSDLEAHSEGLIALSGGPDGPVNRLYCGGAQDEAVKLINRLSAAFPDRFYIELQRHDVDREKQAEAFLLNEAYAHKLPVVATNEAYFPDPAMHEAHDALLCIADGAYLDSRDRRKVTRDHDFKTSQEMRERFADLPEALDSTIEIARRCAFRPRTSAPILPSFNTGEGRTENEELAVQARDGLKARLTKLEAAAPVEDYEKRLEYELGVIEGMGFPGYFLIVSDFIKWAKAHDVPVGPGRGSGAGSLVAWSLTITDLDPIRYGLIFERFLNPERVSMPDFDIDFCQERRGHVIDYVQKKYGDDRVAQIITFGTLQARAVLRDVGRVMQLPYGQVDRLAKLVPSNPANPVTLAEAVQTEDRIQAWRKEESDVDTLISMALKLEGLFRNASTHAAGVVIGDRPLTEMVPLYRDPRSDIPATQFNMKWVEPAGLVKFDFLGLKTLTVIARALNYLEEQDIAVDLEKAPDDDPATFELLSAGNSIGVFQMESTGMRDTLRKVKPDTIEDIIALISLYRPGPMKNIDSYVARKYGDEEIDYLHPDLEPVLKETYGIIIYQEQVMQIAQILSGYSLGEADLLRRAMGKKIKEEMDKQKARFLEGTATHGLTDAKASHIFDLVAEFAGYGFNKSHAAAYAVIAYRTAYLKANYPVEFLAALMSLDIANTDKLAMMFQEARRIDVQILPPDINRSEADFAVEDGAIHYALGAIRNVGRAAMEHVVAARKADGPFKDLYDFAERVDPKLVNKRAFENLARSGAFDSLEPDRSKAYHAAETLLALAASSEQDRASSQSSLFGGEMQDSVRPPLPGGASWTAVERLDEELSAIGFYLSGHPLDDMVDSLRSRAVTLFAEAPERAREGASALRLAGMVRARQERVSSKSGERFAFLALSDPTGEFEVLVPPETLRRSRDDMETGAAVSVRVRVDSRDGDIRFFADSVEPLDRQMSQGVEGFRVFLSDPKASTAISESIRQLQRVQQGEGVIRIVMPLPEGQEGEFELSERILPDPGARRALAAAAGVDRVEEL